jgi:hypothetical protein
MINLILLIQLFSKKVVIISLIQILLLITIKKLFLGSIELSYEKI